MKSNRSKNQLSKGNIPISAAAIQEHLSKGLSLRDPVRQKVNPSHGKSVVKKQKPSVAEQKKQNTKDVLLCEKNFGGEKVLDPPTKPATLAERLGIFGTLELPLTEDEWKIVKSSSNSRNDSANPCAVCQEPFGLEPQVLLSCSHVFHRTCLRSFERFSGKRSCPMCRKEKYQARLIFEGAKLHLDKAATKLQACWRGYLVRRWYKKIRDVNPPKDNLLRRKFYESKLEKMTDNLLDSVDRHASDVSVLMSEIDDGLNYSRKVLGRLEAGHMKDQVDWMAVQITALNMDITDCPICLMPVDEGSMRERPVALLSCAHLYHYVCLQMYEECELVKFRHCPVCRSVYTKKKLANF